MVGRNYPRLMNAYENTHDSANENRRIAIAEHLVEGINIATICPTESELIVGKTTIEREKLVEGAYMLATKTFRFFSGTWESWMRYSIDFEYRF